MECSEISCVSDGKNIIVAADMQAPSTEQMICACVSPRTLKN